jgi:hypothetical protein
MRPRIVALSHSRPSGHPLKGRAADLFFSLFFFKPTKQHAERHSARAPASESTRATIWAFVVYGVLLQRTDSWRAVMPVASLHTCVNQSHASLHFSLAPSRRTAMHLYLALDAHAREDLRELPHNLNSTSCLRPSFDSYLIRLTSSSTCRRVGPVFRVSPVVLHVQNGVRMTDEPPKAKGLRSSPILSVEKYVSLR